MIKTNQALRQELEHTLGRDLPEKIWNRLRKTRWINDYATEAATLNAQPTR